jgi:hypothetical protein
MRRSALLFGPDGRWFKEDSSELFAELGDPNPDYDASRFAVVNLGFVKLELADLFAEITLNPTTVLPTALAALHKSVPWSRPTIVRLRYIGEPEESNSALLPRDALARLFALRPGATIIGHGTLQ